MGRLLYGLYAMFLLVFSLMMLAIVWLRSRMQ